MATSRSLDRCFKCQQLGHWAKDCASNFSQEQFPQFSLGNDVIPPKLCHCGRDCLIRISKSSANPGRTYYKCFQCNFFQWCDGLEASASQSPKRISQSPDLNPYSHSRNPDPGFSTSSWNGPNPSLISPSNNSSLSTPSWNGSNPSLISPSNNSSLSTPSWNGSNPSSISSSNNPSLTNPSDNANNGPFSPKSKSNTSAPEELRSEQQFATLLIRCECKAGPCRVSTARTERNKGKQFLTCPIMKCNFFKWCEDLEDSVSQKPKPKPNPNSSPNNPSNNPDCSPISPTQKANTSAHEEVALEQQFAALSIVCECGAGPCRVLTSKTEKNKGRRFYACHIRKGEGACGFFKWCN